MVVIFFLSINLFSQNQLTFQVDMRIPLEHSVFRPLQGDSLVLRGNFNGWQGSRLHLSDADFDSIYTLSHDFTGFEAGVIEYKFVIRQGGGREIWEQNPEKDNPPYGNRKIVLSGSPQIMPASPFDLDRYLLNANYQCGIPQLQEDYRQMRETIQGLHPALYDFTDKATFDSLFEARYRLIDEPMTGVEFFRIVNPLMTSIGCGHSAVHMPETWWQGQPDRFFPLQVRLVENKLFVLHNLSSRNEIVSGSRIDSINGLSASEIVGRLLSGISSDGFRKGYRMIHLNERFAPLYALHYGFPEKFRISYFSPAENLQKSIETETVAGKILSEASPPKPLLEFELIGEKSTAILTINNFNYYNEQERFYKFIDSAFAEINDGEIQNLILDLRDNDGGDPFSSAYLLSYLTPQPIPYFDEPFGKYADLAQPIRLAENRFAGSLYTLINGKCFSTTGHLTALLKYHRIGTFIGSETGGTYSCNDAKAIIPLKNTNLMLQVAQGSFAVAVQGMSKDRGIIPDYTVRPAIEDILAGRDAEKEFVLKLIDKNSGDDRQ